MIVPILILVGVVALLGLIVFIDRKNLGEVTNKDDYDV